MAGIATKAMACRRCREPKHRADGGGATFYRLGAAGRTVAGICPAYLEVISAKILLHIMQTPQHLMEPADISRYIYGHCRIPSGNSDGRTARRAFAYAACLLPSPYDGAIQYMGRSAFGLGWWDFPLWGCRAAWSLFVSKLWELASYFVLFPSDCS